MCLMNCMIKRRRWSPVVINRFYGNRPRRRPFFWQRTALRVVSSFTILKLSIRMVIYGDVRDLWLCDERQPMRSSGFLFYNGATNTAICHPDIQLNSAERVSKPHEPSTVQIERWSVSLVEFEEGIQWEIRLCWLERFAKRSRICWADWIRMLSEHHSSGFLANWLSVIIGHWFLDFKFCDGNAFETELNKQHHLFLKLNSYMDQKPASG